MIIFPGLIALLGWNVGVSILSPINALLFINFVPVTTLVISIYQGHNITTFDIIGTVLIIFSLIANNILLDGKVKGLKELTELDYENEYLKLSAFFVRLVGKRRFYFLSD